MVKMITVDPPTTFVVSQIQHIVQWKGFGFGAHFQPDQKDRSELLTYGTRQVS